MKKIFLLLLLLCQPALALKLEVKINGSTYNSEEADKIQIADFLILNCTDEKTYQEKPLFLEASIDYGTDPSSSNSGAKQGTATATRTTSYKDGRQQGFLRFRCISYVNKDTVIDTQVIDIETETSKFEFSDLELRGMSLLINGKPVDQATYKLKVGDEAVLTCNADEISHGKEMFLVASIGGNTASGSGHQKGTAVAKRTIDAKDGLVNGTVRFSCAIWNGNSVYDSDVLMSKEILIQTVTKRKDMDPNGHLVGGPGPGKKTTKKPTPKSSTPTNKPPAVKNTN